MLVSVQAFVTRPLSVHTPHHGTHSVRWGQQRPKSGEITFWNPFSSPIEKPTLSNPSDDSLVERLRGYAQRSMDEVLDWGSFKPTGSDLGLGRLQGYANGIEAKLDEISAWILSYSDLRPDSEQTLAGQAFLATNLAYSLAGALLAQNGDLFLGVVTEITAVASFCYHYGQLESKGVNNLPSVRLALLIDYILAFFSIGIALFYLVTSGGNEIMTVLPPSILALGTLGASWIWSTGRSYMILHGLWHFFSACSGYVIGAIHAGAM